MNVEHEFWIEETTGWIWAVELTDGVVSACFGPLLWDDIDDDLLEVFEYSSGGAAWLQSRREHFTRFEPEIPVIPPT